MDASHGNEQGKSNGSKEIAKKGPEPQLPKFSHGLPALEDRGHGYKKIFRKEFAAGELQEDEANGKDGDAQDSGGFHSQKAGKASRHSRRRIPLGSGLPVLDLRGGDSCDCHGFLIIRCSQLSVKCECLTLILVG